MDIDSDLYKELLELAHDTVFHTVSPSAQDNVTDEVAAQATWEVMRKIEAGEDIRNPQGMIVVVARRRALDARDAWARRRHARLVAPGERDQEPGGIYFSMMSDQLADAFSVGQTTEGVEEWFFEVAGRAGLDKTDLLIAEHIFFDGQEPSMVAERVGMAEKTVRNRMTAIEKAVRTLLETGDSS